jgi:hypothetical protein
MGTNKCELDTQETCKFDWNKYSNTLERFDTRYTSLEARVCKIEGLVLSQYPAQDGKLDQILSSIGLVQLEIGKLVKQQELQERKLADHDAAISLLEQARDAETIKLATVKHGIWKDKFRLTFGGFLLFLWAFNVFFLRHLPLVFENGSQGDNWVSYIILTIAVVFFAGSAWKKGVTIIPRGGGNYEN